jgi:3-deoxy-D-manno-octulosonic-acid transferase
VIIIYYLLYFIVLLLILPYQYFKRPLKIRRRWLRERLGLYPFKNPTDRKSKTPPVVWVHAVSVGEVILAVPLVRKIMSGITPNVVVTTVTDTGLKLAMEKLPEGVRAAYVAFDLPFALENAVSRIDPSVLVLLDTELWPGMVDHMHKLMKPVVVFNGRISNKSFGGYKKIRFFMRRTLEKISVFGMQDDVYAGRIIEMGAPSVRVRVVGNLKYDVTPAGKAPPWTSAVSRPLLVAGSTHEGEEEIILKTYKRLLTDFPALGLILAPRHPERFGAVLKTVAKEGLSLKKRSDIITPPTEGPDKYGVVLLDSIGELSAVYGASDVCFLGGSLVPRGGHNLLEPAFWGRPIVCGPHMDNFPVAGEFLRAGAAVSVNDNTIYDIIREILSDAALRARMGLAARAVFEKNAGSIDGAVNILKEIMGG